MGAVIRQLPMLVFAIIAYNVVALVDANALTGVLFTVPLLSGGACIVEVRDILILAGLVLLSIEIAKATRTTHVSIMDHTLSLGLAVICLIEFLVVPFAGTAVFFLLTVMAFLDVVAGFTVTISGARRDFAAGSALDR